MPQPFASRRLLNVRLFVMMLLQFFIYGAWLPLIWRYMEGLGFTGTQIALVGSSFAIASVLAIFAGNQFVDRTFAAEHFMAGSHLVGGLALIGLFFTRGFTGFFCLMLLYSVCYVPTISVANSIVFSHLRNAPAEFGRVRMGGTIGWILASWPLYFVLKGVGAAELQHALGYIFWAAGGASLVLSAFSLTLPHTPPRPVGTGGAERLAWREALHVLGQKPFLLVLFVVTFLDSMVHNGYFLFTGGYLATVGVRPENIMPVMSIGQVMEIVTMAGLGFFLQRLGWRWTMTIGVLGHVARFLVFAFASSHLAAIIAVQLLHGVCYAFFFATLYIFIAIAFPADVRTSAQGLFNLLVLGLGDLAAKWVFLPLQTHFTHHGVVDYPKLLLVPAALGLLAALILVVGFRPPEDLRAAGARAG